MKKIIFNIHIVIFFLTPTICKSQSLDSVKKLSLMESRLKQLFYPIDSSTTRKYDKNLVVYVVKIDRLQDIYEVRIAEMEKRYFSWYLIDKKDRPLGFLQYKGKLVLVYAEHGNDFFKETRTTAKFDFLGNVKRSNQQESESIPINFEPEVWVYHVTKDKIEFQKKGQFSVLK